MVDNISELTPEIIRSDLSGMDIHKLVGRWIAAGNGETKPTHFVVNTEVQLHAGNSGVMFVAISRIGFEQMLQHASAVHQALQRDPSMLGAEMQQLMDNPPHAHNENMLRGTILSFSADEGRGFARTSQGAHFPFSIADQSASPPDLNDALRLIDTYPAGENIDVPVSVEGQPPGVWLEWEAMITGYTMSVNFETGKWDGIVVLMDAIQPDQTMSQTIPAIFLDAAGIKPASQPDKMPGQDLTKKLDS
jgi:hypothetical protein